MLQQSDGLPRRTQIVLRKAAKALSNANTRAAGYQAEIENLKQRLDGASSTRPRRHICIDPNKLFAEVAEIASAMEDDDVEASKVAKKATKKSPKKTSVKRAIPQLQDMCSQFQI